MFLLSSPIGDEKKKKIPNKTKRRINIRKEKNQRRKIRTIRQPLNERNTNGQGKLGGRFQE